MPQSTYQIIARPEIVMRRPADMAENQPELQKPTGYSA